VTDERATDPPQQYLVAGPPRLVAEVAERLPSEGAEVVSAFPTPGIPERLVVRMSRQRAEQLRAEVGDQLIVELDSQLEQYQID
jgi:hypothetical protein